MKIVTFIFNYILKDLSNNFVMQKIKNKFKRFRLQQINNKKEITKFFFNSIHIITTSIQRLYLYKFYICDLFKNRYKTLMSRNKNIKFKKKVMSK